MCLKAVLRRADFIVTPLRREELNQHAYVVARLKYSSSSNYVAVMKHTRWAPHMWSLRSALLCPLYVYSGSTRRDAHLRARLVLAARAWSWGREAAPSADVWTVYATHRLLSVMVNTSLPPRVFADWDPCVSALWST